MGAFLRNGVVLPAALSFYAGFAIYAAAQDLSIPSIPSTHPLAPYLALSGILFWGVTQMITALRGKRERSSFTENRSLIQLAMTRLNEFDARLSNQRQEATLAMSRMQSDLHNKIESSRDDLFRFIDVQSSRQRKETEELMEKMFETHDKHETERIGVAVEFAVRKAMGK